uniref:Uncharacterized protein n=1 Tax=Romanomermis culicivorax TaxID=13658 RepID=A0A915HNY3_ROMCU
MSTQRILFLFISLSLIVFSDQADLTYSPNLRHVPSTHYKFALLPGNALHRSKRDDVLFQHESSGDDSTEDGFTIVNETDTTNMTFIKIDHKYYELNLYKPEMGKFSDYWIDIPALLQNGSASVKGEIRHKQLAYSYRRAVSQKLTFKFPFYGHETENVTIATGGFVYAGDQVHSWLAATQYIAPLMANFDTTSSNDSNILYADTGDAFIVEWNQVVLRHQAEIGNFTFQVSLHKNGDIWFVYKNIPTEVKRVSDLHHPRKVGLSDAYLFTHTILTLSRRVIYEYHRVEVDLSFVKSGAVIVLKAQPVCIMLKTCRSCMSANLTTFNCTWCDTGVATDSTSNSVDTPTSFCSDREGLNRRRQHWLDFQCHKEVDHVYCNEDEHQTEDEDVDHHHGIEGGSEEEQELESTTITTTFLKFVIDGTRIGIGNT